MSHWKYQSNVAFQNYGDYNFPVNIYYEKWTDIYKNIINAPRMDFKMFLMSRNAASICQKFKSYIPNFGNTII